MFAVACLMQKAYDETANKIRRAAWQEGQNRHGAVTACCTQAYPLLTFQLCQLLQLKCEAILERRTAAGNSKK